MLLEDKLRTIKTAEKLPDSAHEMSIFSVRDTQIMASIQILKKKLMIYYGKITLILS